MMSKVLVLAEGSTEERFIKEVLAPHFAAQGIYLIPKIATTRRVRNGPDFKGGIVSYGKVKFDVIQLLRDTSAIVTTMLDFYNLPSDFPAKATMRQGTCYDRVAYLEEAFKKDVAHRHFWPYLSLHEFEALLFAEPERITQLLPKKSVATKLRTIKAEFDSPEEINDDEPPSRRIVALLPRYRKPAHGILIAAAIGLDRIRAECPHFDQWVKQLEELGGH